MYQPVIGLEIHIQAKTKTKMFCSCSSSYFGAEPNSHVCPVCLGLPGALPVPNKAGIDQALRLALALGCEVNRFSKFDRKNYFYPDLPKGYQISQYDLPFGENGVLPVGADQIRIRRVHLEEDTGKSVHEGDFTYLDYNKSGVPLIEVVTEPDFTSTPQVTAFAKLLRQIVIYTGVSMAEMQKGQMRFELNLSLRTNEPAGELPPYRVEVKNIGSISVLEKVIEFEVARQRAVLESGQKLTNETRGLKDMTGETVAQRVKEGANDYRYFPEPDIPPIHIDAAWLAELSAAMPELPLARKQRYLDAGIAADMAEVLVEQMGKGDVVDTLITELAAEPALVPEAVKWFIGEVSGLLEKKGVEFSTSQMQTSDLIYVAKTVSSGEISSAIAKSVLAKVVEGQGRAAEIVQTEGLAQVEDSDQIAAWVQQAIAENPQVIASLAKNPNAAKSLIGKVMAMSGGRANPRIIELEIEKALYREKK